MFCAQRTVNFKNFCSRNLPKLNLEESESPLNLNKLLFGEEINKLKKLTFAKKIWYKIVKLRPTYTVKKLIRP
jgi:hypothetical protein